MLPRRLRRLRCPWGPRPRGGLTVGGGQGRAGTDRVSPSAVAGRGVQARTGVSRRRRRRAACADGQACRRSTPWRRGARGAGARPGSGRGNRIRVPSAGSVPSEGRCYPRPLRGIRGRRHEVPVGAQRRVSHDQMG